MAMVCFREGGHTGGVRMMTLEQRQLKWTVLAVTPPLTSNPRAG